MENREEGREGEKGLREGGGRGGNCQSCQKTGIAEDGQHRDREACM